MTTQREIEAQMHQSERLTALGQMAGGIAHDFNNLLQAILGYAQLMARSPGNADVVRRGLDVIEKAANGGAETVRRIQKFARLRPDEPFVTMDLNQVVRDSLAITRPRWEEKKVKGGVPLQLELELGPVPVVMGRPAELNEVITNLVLNAIDAMPKGGTLRIRTRLGDHRHAVITVADTGMGMSEEVRKKVFDPFFTTKGEEGTGLGLSVSHSIVERHGGDLKVDSRTGRGHHLHDHPADRHEPERREPPRAASRASSGRGASCSWTTIRRCSRSWARCSRTRATTCCPSRAGPRPSGSSCPAASTWSSPTWACRR